MVKRANRIVFGALTTATMVVLLFGYRTSTEGPETSAVPAAIAPATTSGSSSTTSGGSSDTTSGGSSGTTSGGSSDSTSGGSSDTTSGGSSDSTSGGSSGAASGGSDTSDQSATTTVTGDAEDTQWGQVQVELTISGGKITDVAVPVYPNNNGRDAEINSYALPQLIQETISAQSASIDMVSGATVTSDGYLRSLQSALDKAGL